MESLRLQITDVYINKKLFKQLCMPVDQNKEVGMYYNRLTRTYVKEKDTTASPECYTEVVCSETDKFIETWVTGYNQELSIAYTDDTLKNQLVDSLRENMTEANGIKLLWLRRISIPKEYYDILEEEVEN